MTKHEFLLQLQKGLSGLPKDDVEEYLTFYGEMIDDRMEDGISEEAAVREMGTVDELVSQIIAEIPLGKLVKEKITPKKKLNVLEIVLLVLGSPVWLSVVIAVFAVILSLYVVLWSVAVTLWAVFASFVICALAIAAMGIVYALKGDTLSGFAHIGMGMILSGLSILLFFGSKAATKGILMLTKKLAIRIKSCFIRKEEA